MSDILSPGPKAKKPNKYSLLGMRSRQKYNLKALKKAVRKLNKGKSVKVQGRVEGEVSPATPKREDDYAPDCVNTPCSSIVDWTAALGRKADYAPDHVYIPCSRIIDWRDEGEERKASTSPIQSEANVDLIETQVRPVIAAMQWLKMQLPLPIL